MGKNWLFQFHGKVKNISEEKQKYLGRLKHLLPVSLVLNVLTPISSLRRLWKRTFFCISLQLLWSDHTLTLNNFSKWKLNLHLHLGLQEEHKRCSSEVNNALNNDHHWQINDDLINKINGFSPPPWPPSWPAWDWTSGPWWPCVWSPAGPPAWSQQTCAPSSGLASSRPPGQQPWSSDPRSRRKDGMAGGVNDEDGYDRVNYGVVVNVKLLMMVE